MGGVNSRLKGSWVRVQTLFTVPLLENHELLVKLFPKASSASAGGVLVLFSYRAGPPELLLNVLVYLARVVLGWVGRTSLSS